MHAVTGGGGTLEGLSTLEKKLLQVLSIKGTARIDELVDGKIFSNITEVMSAASWLKTKGLVDIQERTVRYFSLSEEGLKYLREGLPERRLFEMCKTGQGDVSIESIKSQLGDVANIALMHLKNAGAKISGGKISLPENKIEEIDNTLKSREQFLSQLSSEKVEEHNLSKDLLTYFTKRKGLLNVDEQVRREIRITNNGMDVARTIGEIAEEISQITPEILQTGTWREKSLRKYDIFRFAPQIYGGREHPIQLIVENVREIFLSMGFKEIDYGIVQNAFWNMDALFVPQDHPARDMQDTFYLSFPEKIGIEREDWVAKIKAVHEHGGDTGSEGWEYEWSLDEAQKALLRTHSTVNTIRFLAEHPDEEAKVFSIGRVFRNENIDTTHLPEFMQIEGIVVEEHANLSMLIGILKEFYRKIGFSDVRFHPSYFPFTEPSLEVYTVIGEKTLELGGAGIFRPEVVRPFGVKRNVLAWGLGLERLAMLKFGFASLPEIYSNDVSVLRRAYLAKLLR